MSASKMASASQISCLTDPNYAVICSFLDQFGEFLGLSGLTFKDVQTYLEDTRNLNDELLNILVRLIRRTGQKITFEKWQKGLVKFCHKYSQFDAWELERFGFKNSNLALKLRILKNLLEAQFDCHNKFKEKVNEKTAEELRFQPLGRDKSGLAYWYLLDKDLNLLVYQEEPDNTGSEGWKLVCQTREELAHLISQLTTGTSFLKDEDSRSSTPSTTASSEKVSGVKPEVGTIKEETLKCEGEGEPEEKEKAIKEEVKEGSESGREVIGKPGYKAEAKDENVVKVTEEPRELETLKKEPADESKENIPLKKDSVKDKKDSDEKEGAKVDKDELRTENNDLDQEEDVNKDNEEVEGKTDGTHNASEAEQETSHVDEAETSTCKDNNVLTKDTIDTSVSKERANVEVDNETLVEEDVDTAPSKKSDDIATETGKVVTRDGDATTPVDTEEKCDAVVKDTAPTGKESGDTNEGNGTDKLSEDGDERSQGGKVVEEIGGSKGENVCEGAVDASSGDEKAIKVPNVSDEGIEKDKLDAEREVSEKVEEESSPKGKDNGCEGMGKSSESDGVGHVMKDCNVEKDDKVSADGGKEEKGTNDAGKNGDNVTVASQAEKDAVLNSGKCEEVESKKDVVKENGESCGKVKGPDSEVDEAGKDTEDAVTSKQKDDGKEDAGEIPEREGTGCDVDGGSKNEEQEKTVEGVDVAKCGAEVENNVVKANEKKTGKSEEAEKVEMPEELEKPVDSGSEVDKEESREKEDGDGEIQKTAEEEENNDLGCSVGEEKDAIESLGKKDEEGEKIATGEAGGDNLVSSQADGNAEAGPNEEVPVPSRGRKRQRKQELIPLETDNLRRSSRQRKRPNILEEDLENVPPIKQSKSRASQKSPQKSPSKTRAKRKAAAPVLEESSDDDIPLSQVRKKEKGKGKGKRKGRKKQEEEVYQEEENYQEEEEEEEEVVETPSKKGKKNRKRKQDSDDDFMLSKKKGKQGKQGKSKRGKKRKNQETSSTGAEESSEDSEFTELLHLHQVETESELSFGENSYDEFACEENDPNFTPKLGRNFKRVMSKTGESVDNETVVSDDLPCTKCHKFDHPELILMCDKCDTGYHTTCTLPPLLLVPEGDWYCPPCEHAKLVEELHIKLKDLDKLLKENERLVKRKERLAFVNISLDNILLKQEPEEEHQHQQHKKKKKKKKKEKKHRDQHSSRLRPRFVEETEESDEEEGWQYTRETRERKSINYNFADYDNMINDAIAEDGVEEEYNPEAPAVSQEKPKKEVKKKTPISRGKDIENIMASQETEDCFQEFEQKKEEEKEEESEEKSEEDGDEKPGEGAEEEDWHPPPVVKKVVKPRLTNLDDYEEADDSEEYRATEDSVDEDEEDEEADPSDGLSEESEYKWRSIKQQRRPARGKQGKKRSSKWQDYVVDNFVVDEDESDYSDDGVRRSNRRNARTPIKYNESSDTDISGPTKITSKKKRRVQESEDDYTQSDKSSTSSYSEPEPELAESEDDSPLKKRKRYEDDSDFEDHLKQKAQPRFQRRSVSSTFSRLKAKTKSKQKGYQRMASDSEEESSKSESSESVSEESDKKKSPSKPKAKRRNIIKSSSEESESEKDSGKEGKGAEKSNTQKSTQNSRSVKSESESEPEEPKVKKVNGHRPSKEATTEKVKESFDDVMKSAGFKEAFLEGAGVSEDDEVANSDLSDVSDLVTYLDQEQYA